MRRIARALILLAMICPGALAQSGRLEQAREHLENERYVQAEAAFRDLLAGYPGLIEAHDGLVTALERQGRRREALRWLLEVGQGLVRSGELEPGTRFLERAVGLDEGLASAQAALGHAYLQGQRNGDAETHLKRALDLGETNPMARLYLAAALWELGTYDEAEAVYRSLLGFAGPGSAAARRSLGGLLVFRGDYEEAIPVLGAALGDEADSTQAPYDLARAFEGAGRAVEAIELYRAVIERSPTFLQAHYRLSRLYRGRGEAEKAAYHLERFRALHAENQRRTREEGRLTARLNQGWALLREDQTEAARALFEELPPGPESLRGLAHAYHRLGDLSLAVATIERVLAADPERFDLRLLRDEWRVEAARR